MKMEDCKHRVTFVGLGHTCGYNTERSSWGSMPTCCEENCPFGLKEPESFMDGYNRRWKQKFEIGDVVYPPEYMILDRFGESLPQNERATIIESYGDGITYKAKRENGVIVDVHCFEVELIK